MHWQTKTRDYIHRFTSLIILLDKLVATGTVKNLAAILVERAKYGKQDITGLPRPADWPLTRAVGHPARWGCFQWWRSTAFHPVNKSRMSSASKYHHTRLDDVGTAAAGLLQLTQWHSLLSLLHEEPSVPEKRLSQHQGHQGRMRLVRGLYQWLQLGLITEWILMALRHGSDYPWYLLKGAIFGTTHSHLEAGEK